jgi:hypothetical protein
MSKKSLFNLYLDDDLKMQVQDKINRMRGEQAKGQVAALVRVLLRQFVATPDDKVNPLLIDALEAEYTFSNLKNKRSVL